MTRAHVWAASLTLIASVLVGVTPSTAQAVCGTATDLGSVTETCVFTGQALQEQADADVEAVYTVVENCHSEGSDPAVCNNPRECTVDGKPGTWNSVRRNGVPIGKICITAGDPTIFTPPIAVIVAKKFKNLDWPQSTLTIQPPGGKTLVNFETIFYTTNNQPSTTVLTLIGQTVEIQATPVSYTWHYGDETSATTSSAGQPHPHQDVVHTYTGLDPVEPSVDTVYSGRFRVNGGAWEAIEGTSTVEGEAVDLEILEATPELVTDPNQQ